MYGVCNIMDVRRIGMSQIEKRDVMGGPGGSIRKLRGMIEADNLLRTYIRGIVRKGRSLHAGTLLRGDDYKDTGV